MINSVSEAAQAIAAYNPALAQAFFKQPFNRLVLAQGFARGFVENEEDDIHPVAQEVFAFCVRAAHL